MATGAVRVLWKFEVDGYVVGLDADLEWEFRNPRGGRLKQLPKKAEGHPERDAMVRFLRMVGIHGNDCRARVKRWADRGVTAVPEELAADPVWGAALEEAGIRAVPGGVSAVDEDADGSLLVGRAYEHSLTGHRIVMVVREEAARYRDVTMRHAGWERAEGFEVAYVPGPVPELPFPERALAAHPGMEETVLDAAGRLFDCGLYKKDLDIFFKELEQSAPVLVPLFLDEIALNCLRGYPGGHGVDIEAATAYFGRARLAERERGRPMDYNWLDGRYLHFAGAGAISATTLRARAKELAVKGACTPEHVEDFRELLVARVIGDAESADLWVYAQLPADLARVAKAAGLDPEDELVTLLVDSGLVGNVSLSDDVFWATVLKGKAYERAVAQEPEAARAGVLRLIPTPLPERQALWREFVERSGLLARLGGELGEFGEFGEEEGLAPGEAAEWFGRCIYSFSTRRQPSPQMYELAQRIAPRLRADGMPVQIPYESLRKNYSLGLPLDLIDLLLEHGVPVADPQPLFGRAHLDYLLLAQRPQLSFLRADARFGRELKRLLRALLDMTDDLTTGGNSWYQPHEDKGWATLPPLFTNELGHEVLGEWCAAERERVRAGGFDLERLALLLGRFVHAGAAVDALPEGVRAGLAKELAVLDPVDLLMRELPEGSVRAEAEAQLADQEPNSTYRVKGMPLSGSLLMQETVNCRVGLGKLIARLGKGAAGDGGDPAAVAGSGSAAVPGSASAAAAAAAAPSASRKVVPEREVLPERGVGELCAHMVAWARGADGAAGADKADATGGAVVSQVQEISIWEGGVTEPSARSRVTGGALDHMFSLHAYASRHVLMHGTRWWRDDNAQPAVFAGYAKYPFLAGAEDGTPGKWRVVRTAWNGERGAFAGSVYRTRTSVAVVVSTRPTFRVLLEYAPEGKFADGGPLAAAGVAVIETYELTPQRPPAWYADYARLLKERGKRPARPDLAAALGAATGLSPAAATALLVGQLQCTPRPPFDVPSTLSPKFNLPDAWEVRQADVEAEAAVLDELLDRDDVATLYDLLLPDDAELLWTEGPDVARAARWWRERFGEPIPVPDRVLPLARKELVRPTGEDVFRRDRQGRREPWWPMFRFDAVAARVATGAGVLDEGLPLHAGRPDLLGSVRVAAWLAYRTPYGDPLRPAIGAAIGRLRAEVADRRPGTPLTLFATQSNYLMGAPDALEFTSLGEHPAVTVEDDPVHDMRNVRVDPALLAGPADPVLDGLDGYLDSVLPSQWVPASNGLPGTADLRVLLSPEFGELGRALEAESERHPEEGQEGGPEGASGWAQDPTRSAPHVVAACAEGYGLGADAASYFLMLAVLPDPTDRMVKQWTGWKPARFKAAKEELAASGRVLAASRTRAGRSLFVPGQWLGRKTPRLPVEASKARLLGPYMAEHRSTAHLVTVPHGPVAALFEGWAAERGLPLGG
ncbi:hypothetical protein GCM10010329_08600 [Streptomyces spiroverticillatus]|uniref:DNA-binding protein n=1 Tax=Streptomyces finlayi TaxID=67296 RepID=A0A919C7F8_9ACTN|nr:hypothetical protein [Streptomyces finlayi]GGZ90235.1 hypothetical protein GCM10010329_08600 [Streptomyces spiroverticillatus]GHC81084.1 hypothetical protein GCM10010334_08590 [Streptomyces finlayi]